MPEIEECGRSCAPGRSLEWLNRECFCVTLDREALDRAVEAQVDDATFYEAFIGARPHLFSNTPVFLSRTDIDAMLATVRAIEEVARLEAYRESVRAWAPEIALGDHGPRGVFMGYDFHLRADGPRLIEVNTNAGGAFLNALLVKAQAACCTEVETAIASAGSADFEAAVIAMFDREWELQGRAGKPRRIAIVDDVPEEQYLYPEFVLAQKLFGKHGREAVIADASALRYERGELRDATGPVDLVYNRLVDFALARPEHDALRNAYVDGAAVVTPNPHNHALLADKRNLTLLSDEALLRSWGVASSTLAALAHVPRTVLVTPENADDLWTKRKSLFFKPVAGHGSKAVYRGDKVTKGVWAEIARGGFVAQDYVAASERLVKIGDAIESRKTDVRLYVYDGELLLAAARLYQGQATNFRTPGGGFAPVFVV